MYLYGNMLRGVRATYSGCDKRVPKIKNKMESASFIPFRDVRYSPNNKGSKNTNTNPSGLSSTASIENAIQKVP